MPTRPLVLAAAAAVALLAPGRASAHDLRLVVMLPPDRPAELVVEAGFDDDTPAEGAKVTVTADGAVVAEGKTDERGVCKLARPGPGKYTATVESAGHKDGVAFEVGGGDYFSRWRLDKTLGVALGVGGLLAASTAFWWLRLRHAR